MATKKPRILYVDIENSRMTLEFKSYSLYDNNRLHPSAIKEDWYITCAAWAWLDVPNQKVGRIQGAKTSDFTSYDTNYRDDYGILVELREAMSQADLIIGHNSDSFDIKKINYKFVKHGLEPLDLPPTVDTLKAARKYLRSSSNSLYYLAKEFGVPMKVDLPKGTMWKADDGCEKSLDVLFKYCKGDIKAGANLYFKLLPYIKNHPNINKTTNGPKTACGSCGSKNVSKNGTRKTRTAVYQRYLCNDCGSSTQGKKV